MAKLEGKILDRKHKTGLQDENPLADLPEPKRTFSDRLQEAQDMKTYD